MRRENTERIKATILLYTNWKETERPDKRWKDKVKDNTEQLGVN